MTRRFFKVACAAILGAACAAPAGAEVVLESSGWQAAMVERPQAARFADAASVALPERPNLRLRGKAVLKNRGPKPAEGLLLRYTATARLVKAGPAPEGGGVWAVPFLIDERRVAKIPPNSVMEVPLSLSPLLDLYVKRMARHGFRPDRLRLQVMIEPRSGDELPQTAESVLEVLRP